MTSKQQVKKSLELALSLAESLGPLTPSEKKEFFGILESLNKIFSKTVKHPIDTLLKKGKVTLPEGRHKQLIQIFDELQVIGVKFLGAKQNDHVTWFPLELNGDKTAALYLVAEWEISPISTKANGELTGEWEGFELTEFMAMNCPEFDQDDY